MNYWAGWTPQAHRDARIRGLLTFRDSYTSNSIRMSV